ncbi:MAG: AI-2E family transporter, partial [Deltaproteobacteria bacterium]|nr:AI-2E family transporter [Deltaproteobacteria bacterium]
LLSKIGSLLGVQNLAFLSITTSLTRSLVNSCLIVALVQATLSGIGLYLFDVKYSLILSFLMFVLAFTPIGPVLLYIPLSVILAFLDFKSAIGVFFWHAILVSGVDNLLRPFLIARSIPVSDGLLLFSTLGGIMLFGFLGLFVAPILIGLTYHLLNSKNLAFN